MRSLKIAAIIVLGILILFLIAIMHRGMTSGFGWPGSVRVETDSSCSLVQEREFPAEEISSLSIRYYNFMNVVFYESPGDTVLVREYLNFTPGKNQLSRIETDGNTLSVQGPKGSFTSFTFLPVLGYTEIYLPAALYDTIQVQTVSGDIRSEISLTLSGSFSASSTSGDILVPAVEADTIVASSTSGDITLTDLKASGKVSASTTSGDIRIDSAFGSSVSFSTTSGDISLGQLSGESSFSSTSGSIRIKLAEDKIEADTVSGDIRLTALSAPFHFNTTSGDITVESGSGSGKASSISGEIRLFLDQELAGSLTLRTTSGDIFLSLPETASFSLDFDSTSGECSTFFDDSLSFNKKGNHASGQYGGNSENKLTVSTTSGSLRITCAH